MKKLLLFLIINIFTVSIHAALPKPPPALMLTKPVTPPAAPVVPKIMPIPPAPIVPPPMQQKAQNLPKPVPTQTLTTVVFPEATKTTQIKDDLGSITIENLSNINAIIAMGTGIINNQPNQKIFINKTIEAKKKEENIILYNFTTPTDTRGQAFNALTSLTINGETVLLPNNQENPTYAGDTVYINNINNKWQIVAKPKSTTQSTILKPAAKAAQTINANKQRQVKSSAAKAVKTVTGVPPKTITA
jgi:hypothetical protein